MAQGRPDQISPHTLARVLVQSPAAHIAAQHGFKGPMQAPSTACAAGAHALGGALASIRAGDADVVVAGGAESCIDTISISGFHK